MQFFIDTADVAEIREELAYVRLLLEDVLNELRATGAGGKSTGSREPEISFPYHRDSSEVP